MGASASVHPGYCICMLCTCVDERADIFKQLLRTRIIDTGMHHAVFPNDVPLDDCTYNSTFMNMCVSVSLCNTRQADSKTEKTTQHQNPHAPSHTHTAWLLVRPFLLPFAALSACRHSLSVPAVQTSCSLCIFCPRVCVQTFDSGSGTSDSSRILQKWHELARLIEFACVASGAAAAAGAGVRLSKAIDKPGALATGMLGFEHANQHVLTGIRSAKKRSKNMKDC